MIRRDSRWRRFSSSALWIPAIWLALGSSRGMGWWFNQFGLMGGQSSRLEGSPVNIIFNNGLFIVALVVLYKRRFSWAQSVFANKAVYLLYAFFLCSALWSPFLWPTVKRLVQEFGWMFVVPIILTEQDPAAAARVVFVRVSYVLFPLSPILIRYFPSIGRVMSAHGSMMPCGVADHKNALGQLCFVFCLFLIWDLMETRKANTGSPGNADYLARLLNLGIGLYLLVVSSSATSLMCFLIGLALLLVSKRLAAMKNARRVFMLGVLATLLLLVVEQTYHLSTGVSETFGRGSGMSGRSEIWQVTLRKNTNYLIGAGFRGFWETDDGKATFEELGTGELITAHNGYIETYLNGGIIGLFFLGVFIWSTGLSATAKLVEGDPIGRLAAVFWPIILIYNLSESQFLMTGPVWYAMLLTTIDLSQARRDNVTVRGSMIRSMHQLPQRSGDSSGAMAHATVRFKEIVPSMKVIK